MYKVFKLRYSLASHIAYQWREFRNIFKNYGSNFYIGKPPSARWWPSCAAIRRADAESTLGPTSAHGGGATWGG